MIFRENHLLADDSHEISYLIFFRKLGKMSQNLSSAAVVIGALRVNAFVKKIWCRLLTSKFTFFFKKIFQEHYQACQTFWIQDRHSVGLDLRHSVSPDLGPNCLQRLSADDKSSCYQGKTESQLGLEKKASAAGSMI